MDFDFVYFGQTCLKYKTPVDVFAGLTEIYEKRKLIQLVSHRIASP